MSFIELFLLAIGLSMDDFAVSICLGLNMGKITVKKALIIGLYFGIFQAGMPVIGFLTASLFAERIIAYDHWIAFGLLTFLGGKMIFESRKKDDSDQCDTKEISLKPAQMLPLAIATSIDALAVGVSFAFLRVNIIPAVSFIGISTLVISIAGVKIGHVCGSQVQTKAEFTGGVILMLIGLKILLEHFGIINF